MKRLALTIILGTCAAPALADQMIDLPVTCWDSVSCAKAYLETPAGKATIAKAQSLAADCKAADEALDRTMRQADRDGMYWDDFRTALTARLKLNCN